MILGRLHQAIQWQEVKIDKIELIVDTYSFSDSALAATAPAFDTANGR